MLAEIPDAWEAALDELLRPRAGARPGVRLAAVAGGARRLAGRPRPVACVRREGDARGRRRAPRGPTPTPAYERAVHAAVDAAFDDDRVAAVLAELSERDRRSGVQQRARGQAGRADHARRARRLPGHASCGTRASSTPTTGDRSTSRTGRLSSTAQSEDPAWLKLAVVLSAADPPAGPARAVHDVRPGPGDRRRRRARAGVRPRRRGHRDDPAAGRPGRARLGRHRARAAAGQLDRRADRAAGRCPAGRPRWRRTPSRCWSASHMSHGPFAVWAPTPHRVRLAVGDGRGGDGPVRRRLVDAGGAGPRR